MQKKRGRILRWWRRRSEMMRRKAVKVEEGRRWRREFKGKRGM